MRWTLGWIAVLAIASTACTEHFTTPGDCPTFCPGGQAVFRDTVLTPIVGGDSSFTGYVAPEALPTLLTSTGGIYGEHRAVIRFVGRGDSVLVSDTNRAFSIDSVAVEIGIFDRDTTVSNFVLEVYRLPLTIDSTSSFADVDAAMTPANKIGELAEGPAFRTGFVVLTLPANAITFTPADSEVLQVGLRVRADGPTAAEIGAPPSGSLAPLFTSYVEAIGVPDSVKTTTLARISNEFFTVTPPQTAPSTTLLAVGGFPVSRSFLRFELPPFLRDSATIIRATLNLHNDSPVTGIPGDTATLVTSTVLVDFGPKSPILSGLTGLATIRQNDTTVSVEVATLVQAWQGQFATPPILRLNLAEEGATFIAPLYRSSLSASGIPTLRITYRPPFAFKGY